MQDAHRSVVNNSLHSEEGLMFVLCLCVTDLPTCLLCVCLTGSVYCEEVSPDVTSVPSLPKETAYLYARFNKIKKIRTKDFADIGESPSLLRKEKGNSLCLCRVV